MLNAEKIQERKYVICTKMHEVTFLLAPDPLGIQTILIFYLSVRHETSPQGIFHLIFCTFSNVSQCLM